MGGDEVQSTATGRLDRRVEWTAHLNQELSSCVTNGFGLDDAGHALLMHFRPTSQGVDVIRSMTHFGPVHRSPRIRSNLLLPANSICVRARPVKGLAGR